MGLDALNSASPNDFSAFRSAGNLRNLRNNSALSLIPTASASKGLGLGADIYDSVSRQTQGLYAGGRAALMSAYAALGIDVREKSYAARPEEETAPKAEEPEKAEETEEPTEPESTRRSRNITDELLKEGGYVKPEANPWVVRTDFFA